MARLCQPSEIAKMSGLSYDYVIAACKRGPQCHPLKHINTGTGRKGRYYIDPKDFEEWLDTEKALQVGATV